MCLLKGPKFSQFAWWRCVLGHVVWAICYKSLSGFDAVEILGIYIHYIFVSKTDGSYLMWFYRSSKIIAWCCEKCSLFEHFSAFHWWLLIDWSWIMIIVYNVCQVLDISCGSFEFPSINKKNSVDLSYCLRLVQILFLYVFFCLCWFAIFSFPSCLHLL